MTGLWFKRGRPAKRGINSLKLVNTRKGKDSTGGEAGAGRLIRGARTLERELRMKGTYSKFIGEVLWVDDDQNKGEKGLYGLRKS